MIDIWFQADLARVYNDHNVAVFTDETGDAEFLLNTLPSDYVVYRTSSDLTELQAKYNIEKSSQSGSQKHLIYTQRAKEDLSFVREYFEVYGGLEIRNLPNYIKDKLHQTLNLNINFPREELIAAAKVSVGKDKTYWLDLSHKGSSEIFDLDKELLPFVHAPDQYAKEKFDPQLMDTFYRKVNELLGQAFIAKPAATLAEDVVKALLNGLACNNCHKSLLAVYRTWLDSVSYKPSFSSYLSKYKLDKTVDIWQVHPDHPFQQVDEAWLKHLGSKLVHKTLPQNERIQFIAKLKQRHQSKPAQALGITFWGDVIALLEFDPKDISYLSNLAESVEFYKKHFAPLDTAIRNLYTQFLQQPSLLSPFQELYKEYVSVFFDKWFNYFDQYQQNQTGILQRIIDASVNQKIAVIVGDGVAYEIAEQVASKIQRSGTYCKLTRNHILADYPSETENNMSHIYMANGLVEAVQAKREKYLAEQNLGLSIDFIRLDEVADTALAGQLLVCTYKDIDDMGDKLNNKALKYFPESVEFFAEKISQLLQIGYTKVYLITDHGFVLTGLLSESDKISVKPSGQHYIDERFIWTSDKQPQFVPQYIEMSKQYKEFNYLYFARSMNPFKTPGTYGFAHGGLAPQELVTPYFCWERETNDIDLLNVTITNKANLESVTGELFQIKLIGTSDKTNLFTQERKVMLLFFAKKNQVSKSDVIALHHDETATKEFTFDGYDELEVQVIDAISKQQLDRVTVYKNNDRDLGGLF